ncbi:AWPM-19-like [Dillenia turbinata]|uniref:AWPM-19-like n=1 Tax=Dillenia turbinata TaxID=194707 RepID=A0AAN8VAI4_9MAGN
MDYGRGGKDPLGPLLVANFVVYLVVLVFVLIFAVLSGVLGACSLLAGVVHHQTWRSDSLANAASSALISWAVAALAFGFVCKQMALGGHRGKRLETLEAFVAISVLTQLLYLFILHAGVYDRKYGPSYGGYSTGAPTARTTTGTTTTDTGDKPLPSSMPVVV